VKQQLALLTRVRSRYDTQLTGNIDNCTSGPGSPIMTWQGVLLQHLSQLGSARKPCSAVIDVVDEIELLSTGPRTAIIVPNHTYLPYCLSILRKIPLAFTALALILAVGREVRTCSVDSIIDSSPLGDSLVNHHLNLLFFQHIDLDSHEFPMGRHFSHTSLGLYQPFCIAITNGDLMTAFKSERDCCRTTDA